MEARFPGMWLRWLRHQAVGIGWPPQDSYHLTGSTEEERGWKNTRTALCNMGVGDFLFSYLGDHRIGRLGEIVDIKVGDGDWAPLVEPKVHPPHGEMGRRVLVRWDFVNAPDDLDLVVRLPKGSRLRPNEWRGTIREIQSQTVSGLREVLKDRENWVGIVPRFRYERALANYIGAYPHRLEQGLLPHPDLRLWENVFADGSRADVLLIDPDHVPVVVECKQHGPSKSAIDQLRGYMAQVVEQSGPDTTHVRGILVHGGTRRSSSEIREYAAREPKVEVVHYGLDVVFSGS